ncbi:MAG: PAS domain-containing protein [Rhodospirillaceae bacterium]|nr:MAG: PAS domain-containing protein [Rhodospirillaceae bacterium]
MLGLTAISWVAVLVLAIVAWRLRRRAIRAELNAAHHRTIIETTSEGYWEVDSRGRVQAVNAALCQLLGRGEAALLGQPAMDFMPESDRALLAARLSGQGTLRLEVDLIRSDGHVRHTRFAITILRDDPNPPARWFAIIIDRTDRKRVESDIESILHRADQALYQAKHAGRNQVVVI